MIQVILDELNSFHEMVKFTVEIEENNSINFLDLTVHKLSNGGLRTNWYCKPIAANRVINYYSSHPRHMIHNTAKSLIKKIYILSHRSFCDENETKIFAILRKNNFPDQIIRKLIH